MVIFWNTYLSHSCSWEYFYGSGERLARFEVYYKGKKSLENPACQIVVVRREGGSDYGCRYGVV